MAEALARKISKGLAENDIEVSSAGTAAWPGDGASREAVEALARMGVSLGGHRASRLTAGAVREADLVLTMTAAHRDYVKSLVPEASGKTFTLGEYAGAPGDVPDPIGQPLDKYVECARMLEDLITRALRRVRG